jgi:uncharacterized Rossmann fold enzyme
MKLDTWLPLYESICKDFGFNPAEDLKSAQMLAKMIGKKGIKSFESTRSRSYGTVLVCGGGGDLADELSSTEVRWPVVAADRATTVLLESGIKPDLIVTDLDGLVEDQIEANAQGVPVFVHAHGDNKAAIDRYVKRFTGGVIGTCQCRPPENLFNFGGFTDGDRAACISAELGARTVLLAGFDFENPSEKLGKNKGVKMRKLRWARTILDELAREGVRIVPIETFRDR